VSWLTTLDTCIEDRCSDVAIRIDRLMDGLVNQQIIIWTLSDNFEVVNEGELRRPVDEWKRILLLSHTCGLV